MSGRYGSKLPAYSSASTTNAGPCRSGPSPAAPPVSTLGQQRPDEGRRVATGGHEQVDEPARGRALAVRPGHPDQGPSERRVGDDLLPRLERDPGGPRRGELRMVGVDRGQGLRHGQPFGPRRRRHVRRGVLARPTAIPSASTAGVYGEGAPGSQPVTTAPACAARMAAALGARHRPRRRRGSAPSGRIGRAGRAGSRPGPDPRAADVMSRVAVASIRSSSSSSAAAALRRLLSDRSPVQGNRRTVAPSASADRDVGQSDRLLRRPAVRPGDPGDRDARGRPRSARDRRRPSPSRPGRTRRRAPPGRPPRPRPSSRFCAFE